MENYIAKHDLMTKEDRALHHSENPNLINLAQKGDAKYKDKGEDYAYTTTHATTEGKPLMTLMKTTPDTDKGGKPHNR